MCAALPPIELRPLSRDNFDCVVDLQVAPEQREFLNSNVETIAWAHVAPESFPLVIYAADMPVGLTAYGYIPEDGRCWIIHFMVDEASQRKGVGRAALEQLLERMAAVSGGARVAVAVHPDNAAAIALYEAFGFQDTGQRQNGEMIMRPPALT